MRLAGGTVATAAFILLALYSLAGRAQVIQALALSWLFAMLNPGLAAETTGVSMGRYVVLAAAAVSVLIRSVNLNHANPNISMRTSQMVLGTLLLGAFVIVHSILVSPIRDVSLLKAISWTVAMATLLMAWGGLSPERRDALVRQLFGGLVVLMLASLPLLAMPVGYLRNEMGFQGVLSHPQAFGPTMALLGAWSASQLLAKPRPEWTQLAIVGACMVLVVLSEARTAGFALVLALVISVLTAPVLSGRSLRDLFPGLRSGRMYLILFLAVGAAMAAAPFLSERIGQYLVKRGEAQSLAMIYEGSRGVLIEPMWDNIQEHPVQGIGFGVASFPEDMVIERDPVLGLPVSASVEKGVLPMMVLEELGVFGAIAAAIWLWMVLRRSAIGGGVSAMAVVCTAVLFNMGEATLFSPGGMGLLLLILIAWAASASHSRGRGPANG